MPEARLKTGLDIQERARLTLFPKHVVHVPVITRPDILLTVDPNARGDFDHLWGASTDGTYIITSAKLNDAEAAVDDSEGFRRAWVCAAALNEIGIPNFATADPDPRSSANWATEARCPAIRTADTILYAPLTSWPLGTLRLTNALCDPSLPLHEVMSLYMQVVLSVIHAHDTAAFAHNALRAKNIRLAPYAKVFTVNYGRRGILCFGSAAVITNYHHAQIAYVTQPTDDDKRWGDVVCLDPPSDGGRAINLATHPGSDIYQFTLDCEEIVLRAREEAPLTGERPIMTQRVLIFKDLLDYYGKRAGKRHRSVETLGMDINEFVVHAQGVLKKAKLYVLLNTPVGYENYHLSPPPVDPRRAHIGGESTWHALDLRGLVAYGPPPASPDACRQAAKIGYKVRDREREPALNGQGTPAWNIFHCSAATHLAAETVVAAPAAATSELLAAACSEFPFLLCLGETQYGAIMATLAGKARYEAAISEILNKIVCEAGTFPDGRTTACLRIKDYLGAEPPRWGPAGPA
jgi:hypothetical protein